MPPKIRKPWVDWETFRQVTGFTWVPSAHTHVGANITDLSDYFTNIVDVGTSATNIAAGTTGQRPAGVVGDMRYNSTLGTFEVYTGAWESMAFTGDAPTAHAASHHVAGADLVNHDSLIGFVGNEHIDHTGVTMMAGSGLSGGGTIVANRTFNLGALTGNWDAGAFQIRALKFYSDQATGTPPFTVLSTTKVTNLNVERVDDLHAASFIRSDADDNVTGHTEWQDNKEVRFGAGADFRIWHSGTHSYLRSYLHGANVYLQAEDAVGALQTLLTADPDMVSIIVPRLIATNLTDGYVPYHVSDALGLANSGIYWDSVNSRVGINLIDPDEDLEVAGKVKATEFLGNLHWDYLTNKPSWFIPAPHIHIGKDVITLYLIDTNDEREVKGDPLDIMPIGDINGEGIYDWANSWVTNHQGANCLAELEAGGEASGDPEVTAKYLRLTDSANINSMAWCWVETKAQYPLITGIISVRLRQSVTNRKSDMYLYQNAIPRMRITFDSDGDIKFFDGALETVIFANYVANTWYPIRVHWDLVAGFALVFVDNVYKIRKAIANPDWINRIGFFTDITLESYTFDVDTLFVYNITI